TGTPGLRPWILLVIDGHAPVDPASVSPLLAAGAGAGVSCVWMGSRIEQLPGDCRVVLALGADGTLDMTDTRAGSVQRSVKWEGVAGDEARALAIAMAPIRDTTAEQASGALPGGLGLLEALDAPSGPLDDWMAAAWRRPPGTLAVPLGEAESGPLVLDLERHGPHGLVAGTTGAGKSELLQSLVGALAAVHPPSRVTFLLIDYKGGTAFSDCRDLPHTVGYVTDLDPSLTTRALTSLNAELRHREAAIAGAGVKDLRGLRERDPAGAPPSLCIVVDEYATLLKELPDFVTGLVDVAQRGRALGVHLVLGTQSPGGTVGQAILANIGFRIALRTASADESAAVIGSEAAVRISPDLPGRAYIRLASGELRLFQAAYASARGASDATSSIRVVEFGFRAGGRDVVSRPDGPSAAGATDLAAIAEASRWVFDSTAVSAPHRPWLPPLLPVMLLADWSGSSAGVPIGLADEPERQSQTVVELDLESAGGMIVFGMAGSGKTTLLRTAAAGLAGRTGPGELHIYGMDFGAGGLRVLESLPHCGSVIAGDDLERGVRLLRMLRREIAERRAALAAAARNFADAVRSGDPVLAMPRILVILDGYEGFVSAYERVAFGEWSDALARIVVDGRTVGIHFLVSAARRFGVPTPVVGALERRVVLRQAEPDDYIQLGLHINVRQVPALPPGRGFVGATMLMQALVAGGPGEEEQARAFRELGASLRAAHPGEAAPPVGLLPLRVSAAQLPARAAGDPFPIGIGDDALAPVGLDPAEGHVLVAGPGRSGRTTALAAIALSVRRSGVGWPVHMLSPRTEPGEAVAGPFDAVHAGIDACTEFLLKRVWEEARRVSGGSVVLIDDCDELADQLSDSSLVPLLRRRPSSGPWFVVACEVDAARHLYGDWFAALRRHRNGLLLSPDVDLDGDLLGTRLPRSSTVPGAPGRGYLVRRERVELAQVAGD
ncbi:MAG: FtsK/SpoIIIE domain-containing protein, partial [Candidatus Limnocylindrales bacterium]